MIISINSQHHLRFERMKFQNRNKCIALTTLLVFLTLNKKWIKADIQELYNFSIWIASSYPRLKDEVVSAIEKIIKIHLVPIEI